MDSCLWSIPNLLPKKKYKSGMDGKEFPGSFRVGGAEKLLLDHELTPACSTKTEFFSC